MNILYSLALIAWTLFIFWCGYSDGKLGEQERRDFERLDELIAQIEPSSGPGRSGT